MIENNFCRILSLDGGGIRGLVSTLILEELERRLKEVEPKKSLVDYFDIIAGTSAGSLTACGLSKGLPISYIKNLYINRGKEIFPRTNPLMRFLLGLLKRIHTRYSQALFTAEGLERVLQEELNDTLILDDLLKPTLVTSYDTYNRQAVVFKNTKLAHRNVRVWEVCRASAAAPIAFPGYVLSEPEFIADWRKTGYKIPPEEGIPLVDGGIFATDPALCAIAERLRWNKEAPTNPKWSYLKDRPFTLEAKNIVVASFGVGELTKQIGIEQTQHWGIAEWISPRKGIPIIDVLFDGSSDAVAYVAAQILESSDNACERRYFRFQPSIEHDISAFKFDLGSIKVMQETTAQFLEQAETKQKLNQLVQLLIGNTPPVLQPAI